MPALHRLALPVVDSLHQQHAWLHLHHLERVAQEHSHNRLGCPVLQLHLSVPKVGTGPDYVQEAPGKAEQAQ